MTREEDEAKHKIFKEELYSAASLDRFDFEIAKGKFLDDHPDIILRDAGVPMRFNKSAFKKFMKTWRF